MSHVHPPRGATVTVLSLGGSTGVYTELCTTTHHKSITTTTSRSYFCCWWLLSQFPLSQFPLPSILEYSVLYVTKLCSLCHNILPSMSEIFLPYNRKCGLYDRIPRPSMSAYCALYVSNIVLYVILICPLCQHFNPLCRVGNVFDMEPRKIIRSRATTLEFIEYYRDNLPDVSERPTIPEESVQFWLMDDKGSNLHHGSRKKKKKTIPGQTLPNAWTNGQTNKQSDRRRNGVEFLVCHVQRC